jgi:acylphosphatase
VKAVKIIVHGIVQGVFYRQSTQEMASSLNVNGTVRNCDDGTVEIYAEGNATDVDKLIEWCRIGPRRAKVTKVELENVDAKNVRGFRIVR